jgi:hypothetical protein
VNGFRYFLFFVFIALAVQPSGVSSAAEPIDKFVGSWVGSAITENVGGRPGSGGLNRQLEVRIEAVPKGFHITWMTARRTVKKGASSVKYWSTSVHFNETERAGVYSSQAQSDLSGGRPYRWAVIADNVLTVHSIAVSQDGRLEHQKYVRTLLSDDEMQLKYTLTLDGKAVRSVIGLINRK